MSRRSDRRGLRGLPRGFAVEKGVLSAGSLAACVAAGLALLHLVRIPAPPGQLPGALSAAGISSLSNLLGWLVPAVAVPGAWLAWLSLLPRAAARWPRGAGSFYRDALGFHFALLAAPLLLLRGMPPGGSALLAVSTGLLLSAAWILRVRLIRIARLLAGPDGALLACGGTGLALAAFAAGVPTPSSLPGKWALFVGIAAAVPAAAIALARGDTERPGASSFSLASRGAAALSLAPAILIAGLRPPIAVAALLAAAGLCGFLLRNLSSRSVRTIAAGAAVPILFVSSVWIGSDRPRAAVSIFEDGHALGPAWEESRGGRAFETITPLHGWLEDGGYDGLAFRLFGPSYGVFRIRRGVFALAAALSIYLLAAGVFGPGALAAAGAAAAFLLSRGGAGPRAAPSLLAAALFAFALRRDSRILAAIGAALAAASVFSSLDFGAYALAACAAAWGGISILDADFRRRFPFALLAASVALGALPFLAVLAATGRLARWLDFSFRVLPRLAREAYALPIPDLLSPPAGFPRGRFLIDPVLFAIGLAVAVALVRRRHPWGRGLLFCAASYLFAYRAVAERLYVRRCALFLGILLVGASALAAGIAARALASLVADRAIPWWRRRAQATAISLVLVAGGGTAAAIAATRESTAEVMNGWISWRQRDVPPSPRAAVPGAFGKGAETTPEIARRLSALRTFFDARLRPDETFFDFSNQPGIHFLLHRRSPVPWPETPAMEEPGAQRRIIEALESRNVRYVLWSWPGNPPESYTIFDSVPNQARLPELDLYLTERYPKREVVEGCEIRSAGSEGSTGPEPSPGTSATAPRPP